MRNLGWVIRLNMLVVAFILVILMMSKVRNGSLENFLANVLGATPPATEVQKAGR